MIVQSFFKGSFTHSDVDHFVGFVRFVAGYSGTVYNVSGQAFAVEWARFVAWAVAGSVGRGLYAGDLVVV